MTDGYLLLDNEGATAVLNRSEPYIEDTGELGAATSETASCMYLAVEALSAETSEQQLETKFKHLADTWEEETKFLSAMGKIMGHQAHLDIIQMGPKVVPLILDRMREKPGFWFDALSLLTGDNPVEEKSLGDVTAMTRAWLEWGQERGYC